MIIKKFKLNSKYNSKSKGAHIADIVNYITDATAEEKIYLRGAVNFISESFEAQKREMIALSHANKKATKPVQHWMMSWKEGEQPSESQVIQALDFFLEGMGLREHQAIYALHQNTDNWHLHIAVNKIHPDSLKSIKSNKGFDIDEAHKVISKIEHIQGWKSEDNTRYIFQNDEYICLNKRYEEKAINSRASAFEIASGAKSAIRLGQEKIVPILNKSDSWQNFHRCLLDIGIRLETKGSGAIFYIGDTVVKASSIGRMCSLKALEQKLGTFQRYMERNENGRYYIHTAHQHDPRPDRLLSELRLRPLSECHLVSGQQQAKLSSLAGTKTPSVLPTNARSNRRDIGALRRNSGEPEQPVSRVNRLEWLQFTEAKLAYKRARHKAKSELDERVRLLVEERSQLIAQHKEDRQAKLAGDWRGRGPALNALRNILAGQQAAEKAVLAEKQKLRRRALRAEFKAGFPNFPTFEEWLRDLGKTREADAWRYMRNAACMTSASDGTLESKQDFSQILPMGIAQFHYQSDTSGHVHYRHEGAELYSFTDAGRIIYIHKEQDAEGLLAAMQLGMQKWGSVHLDGNDVYKNLCVVLAAKHNIKLENPELQEALKEERAKMGYFSAEAQKNNFIAYCNAIEPEHIRLTSIRMLPNDEKKVLVLDKQDGRPDGYLPDEILDKMYDLCKLESKNENIYYTPLSSKKHFVIVDDMTEENIQKMSADGFEPAVILETSPGNFQAILSIQKLGTDFDKDIGNRLTEQLNKTYGDPNFFGCIHPHRAPGFTNRKPNHIRPDGTYPAVKLIAAKRVDCAKALQLSVELENKLSKEKKERLAKAATVARKARHNFRPGDTRSAYYVHLENIRSKMAITDASRVDSMIALRLRATGHSPEAVRDVLEDCAPEWREKQEKRNWQQYAERTTQYAYGAAGDRDLERLSGYVRFWRRLESPAGARTDTQPKNK